MESGILMSDASRRVSYSDIARRAGYHRSTVGLALRKHPGIPEETRARILKVAEEMGYRPDPALSSLSTYRRMKTPDRNYTTIALLSDEPVNAERKSLRHSIRDYYIGVRQRADELGFGVEEFCLGLEDRRFQARVDQILRARGIRTLIVCPLLNQKLPVEIEWRRYSAVCIGYSLRQPELLRVCSQNRTGASDAVVELYCLGYRRIGLVLGQSHDSRVNFSWSAGFYGACHSPDLQGLEFATYMPNSRGSLAVDELVEWIRESRVDAILVAQDDLYDYLVERGFRIPEELGFACLDLPPERKDLAGVDQLSIEVGRQAVDQVAALYNNNEVGLPRNRLIHLVKGQWVQGNSVRKQNPGR